MVATLPGSTPIFVDTVWNVKRKGRNGTAMLRFFVT